MIKEVLSESQVKEVMNRFQAINEYEKRFQKKKSLNEFAFVSDMNEAGEDNNAQGGPDMGGAPQGGGAPMGGPQGDPQGGPDPMGGPQGGGDPMQGGAPMGGPQGDPQGGPDPMGGPQGGGDPMQGGDDPMGVDSAMPMGGDPMGGGEEDEVIDVEDLTQSQESTEMRIDDMNDKLTTLMNVLKKYSEAVDSLDSKITDVKSEIAHRMPSKQEKLALRSVASAPYATTPEDYWAKKMATNPNYAVVDDDNEEKSYDITEDDVNDFNNMDVLRSFNEHKIELKNYLKF